MKVALALILLFPLSGLANKGSFWTSIKFDTEDGDSVYVSVDENDLSVKNIQINVVGTRFCFSNKQIVGTKNLYLQGIQYSPSHSINKERLGWYRHLSIPIVDVDAKADDDIKRFFYVLVGSNGLPEYGEYFFDENHVQRWNVAGKIQSTNCPHE